MESTDDLIQIYFHFGLKYKDICFTLAKRHGIVISERHLKRKLKCMNMARRNFTDLCDAISFIQSQLRGSGQLHGYRIMHSKCREHGIIIPHQTVRMILKELDPVSVDLRRSHRLTRRLYYAKGPNYVWHIDGYDKLKPYGICLHGCIDGFSRKVIWLNAYFTNNNPKIVAGYFLEAIMQHEGCPSMVRGDRGTENITLGRIQRQLRQRHQDALSGDGSYMEGSSTSNQRIECWWGYLRKQCIQFWMEIFQSLKEDWVFNGDILDKSIVQYCFMDLIQVS